MAATDVVEGKAPARHATERKYESLIWGGGAWLALRLIASLAAWASLGWLTQGTTSQVGGYTPPVLHGVLRILAGPWLRADAMWYLRIADAGYKGTTGTYAFLPLFPLLVRLVKPLTAGQPLYAGLLVANAACLAGFVWLYGFVASLVGRRAARATVVGLALFPFSFFLVAPYGEPLLLAAGAGALLLAQRDRPVLAGLAGAAAALSRPFGVLIAIPLFAYLLTRGRLRRPAWWLAPLGPALGLVGWLAWSGSQLHDFLGALHIQTVWQRSTTLPWETLNSGVRIWITFRGSLYGPYFLMDILATAFGIALFLLVWVVVDLHGGSRWLAAALSIYGLVVLAIPLSSPFPPRPLMSMPRFVLALFPLFMVYDLIKPRLLRVPLAVISAGGLAWATALYVAARPIF
ncbi:MAG: hypothetical protein ACRDJU_12475 [Actinomycetota bacterium]